MLAYLAGQIPSGKLADQRGGVQVLLTGSAIWSLATASTVLCQAGAAAVVLTASRVALGLASACIMPAVAATAVQYVPSARKATTIAMIYANFNIGGVAALVLAPLLAQRVGWPAAFVLAGAAGLAWAAAGTLVVGDVVQKRHAAARSSTQADLTDLTDPGPSRSGLDGNSQETVALLAEQRRGAESGVGHGPRPGPGPGQGPDAGPEPAAGPGPGRQTEAHSVVSAGRADGSSRDGSTGTSSGARSGPGPAPSLKQDVGPASHVHLQLLGLRLERRTVSQVAVLCGVHAAIGWGFFIFQNWMPLYMASLGGADLVLTGLLSGLPWLAAAAAGVLAGTVADSLLSWGLSLQRVRLLMHGLHCGGCALTALVLALTPAPPRWLAVACLVGNLAAYGLSFGGFHAYLQDVCGRGATRGGGGGSGAGGGVGVLQGLTNSCSIAMGVLGNLATGALVDATGSYRAVFGATALVYTASFAAWAALLDGRPINIAVD